MQAMKQRLMAGGAYDPEFMSMEGRLTLGRDVHDNVPGIRVGRTFANREECLKAGVHRQNNAGIAYSERGGAYSVVLSGGYEDDQDNGEFIVYTGTGGQSDSYQSDTVVVRHQSFDHPANAALRKAKEVVKKPIRVIRGFNLDSNYAPAEGYRYDGLYLVTHAEYAKGKSGYRICQFHFERLPGQGPIPTRDPMVKIRKSRKSSRQNSDDSA